MTTSTNEVVVLDHMDMAEYISEQAYEAHVSGDDENAVQNYRLSLARNPFDADTRNNLGLIYYRKGELENARKEIEEAIRLQPQFPDACYNLGLILYRMKDLEGEIGRAHV